MRTSETIANIVLKLLDAQKNMGEVNKNANNPHFGNKYANLAAWVQELVPLLNERGILVLQPAICRDGNAGCSTTLVDTESGEFIESELLLPLAKNDAQGAGSCITYARRYSLQSIMTAVAEDDDGNKSVGGEKPERTNRLTPERKKAEQRAAICWNEFFKKTYPDIDAKESDKYRHQVLKKTYRVESFKQMSDEDLDDFEKRAREGVK